MMYGSECWAIDKTMDRKMSSEMRMLRWISGVTREDRIRSSIGVTPIVDKLCENRLR